MTVRVPTDELDGCLQNVADLRKRVKRLSPDRGQAEMALLLLDMVSLQLQELQEHDCAEER
jgi:hypothetical protein